MKADGTNTEISTSAIATNAAPTSSMLLIDASRGFKPASILRCTFSTTTMASSTTMPMASTRPNSDRLLSVNPKIDMKKNVTISDTDMALHVLDHNDGVVNDNADGEHQTEQ